MKTLATTFGKHSTFDKQDNPLSDDQLMAVAPSIFAADKHGSRSERYTYIPTIEVVNGLRNEGFLPFMAAQSKCRIEGKTEFTKHMLRFRRADMVVADEANEIILINSHDGTSSYQMLAGMFRFVCMNGMVTGDKIDDVRIPHRGNIVDNVIEAAYTIIDEFDVVAESVETMKSLPMSNQESEIFAKAALVLKYDDEDKNPPIRADQLLLPKRFSDAKDDLWSKFNTIQENLMKGGQPGLDAAGHRTKTRPVRSIDKNVKLNRALWILADEMARLKT